MSHNSGCILTTVKCEMQKLLENVFYMDKTIDFFHCVRLGPLEASRPEPLALVFMLVAVVLIEWL